MKDRGTVYPESGALHNFPLASKIILITQSVLTTAKITLAIRVIFAVVLRQIVQPVSDI